MGRDVGQDVGQRILGSWGGVGGSLCSFGVPWGTLRSLEGFFLGGVPCLFLGGFGVPQEGFGVPRGGVGVSGGGSGSPGRVLGSPGGVLGCLGGFGVSGGGLTAPCPPPQAKVVANNDKNRTFSVSYVPKVTGLHKVGSGGGFLGPPVGFGGPLWGFGVPLEAFWGLPGGLGVPSGVLCVSSPHHGHFGAFLASL